MVQLSLLSPDVHSLQKPRRRSERELSPVREVISQFPRAFASLSRYLLLQSFLMIVRCNFRFKDYFQDRRTMRGGQGDLQESFQGCLPER